MQLNQGERALLYYFPNESAAQQVAEKLKQEGYQDVQVDRVSRYGVNNDAEINNPIAGRAETITGLTLYSAGTDSMLDDDTRVLKAADPSVSGYGNHNYGLAGGKAFLITLVTNEDLAGRAEEIIEAGGGTL